MKIDDLEITQLELKYCERCGRLWLRQRDTGTVYCEACTSEMPTFPLCGRRVSRPRLLSEKIQIAKDDGADHSGVGWGGGNA
jgi:ribosomal protein L37AE/L43A